MKRTTIFVPESLERDLQLYARKTGKPTAAIVREALADYIAKTRGAAAALPAFAGAFESGHADTASRHDELLFRALTLHDASPPVAARTAAPRARRRAGRR